MEPQKQELHALADGLLIGDPDSIASCIDFVDSYSEGIWHGRARAMMCRRLKHIELTTSDASRLVRAILMRFEKGKFAEQFKDMVKLALVLDSDATKQAARDLSTDSREYVRSQARWVLEHH